jgi:DNA invertase Pin-like site-specific DNA recombinase
LLIVGLKSARARGRLGGRPKIKTNDPKVIMAKKMFADKSLKIDNICKILNISRASLWEPLKNQLSNL